MKLGKQSVIGVGFLLVVALFIYTTQDLGVEAKAYNPSQSQNESDVLLKEVDDYQELLEKKGGFYEQVNEEMKKEGYDISIAGKIYSKDDIRLSITVNNTVVTAQEQENVTKIFKDVIIKNNLDPKAFNIE